MPLPWSEIFKNPLKYPLHWLFLLCGLFGVVATLGTMIADEPTFSKSAALTLAICGAYASWEIRALGKDILNFCELLFLIFFIKRIDAICDKFI